jgi:hypothetical protein
VALAAAMLLAAISLAHAAPPASDPELPASGAKLATSAAQPQSDDAAIISALQPQIRATDSTMGGVNPGWDETKKVVHVLSLAQATRDTMKLVGQLRGLRGLLVSRSDLRASDFAPIATLPELDTLWIDQVPVDSTIFRHLASLPSLRSLVLSETRVTSLAGLERLKALRWLGIEASPLGAGQLAPLGRLTELTQLELSGVGIVNCDLVHLRKLKKLEQLTLVDTKITDCGLSRLQCMTWLEYFYLRGPRLTERGSDWLQTRLPHTQVIHFDDPRPGHDPR